MTEGHSDPVPELDCVIEPSEIVDVGSAVDGVVMERFKSVGEYVEYEPMLRVAQLDPLHVEVIVPVDYLGRISPGMQARVTAVVPNSETHLATVERVDVVSDAASGT